MSKLILILIKLSYLSLCIMIITRILLKCFGYNISNFDHKFIIQPLYEITNTIILPVEIISYKLSATLPLIIQKIFPNLFIKETNGILELPALITLALVIILGVTIERLIKKLLTKTNTKKDTNKTSLNRLNNETKQQKENNPNLKDAYNIIIKRLDREKTELVNKNISLEKEIITDTLTGLKTRKYMDERLKYEFNNAKTRKNNLSLILFDIDNFKTINDNLGHQIGDLVLKDVSKIIISACTNNIVASRYGGEEILIIAPKMTPTKAYNLSETIRCNVQSTLKYGKNQNTSITISAGIVTYNGDNNTTSSQLVEMADKALYKAKNTGKNKSVIYND